MTPCLASGVAADAILPSDPTRIALPFPKSLPLRIQVLSDVHFDIAPCGRPSLVPGVDAVVVAGDTCQGVEEAYAYLRAAFPAPTPLIVVLGNHEFYGRSLPDELLRARSIAARYEISLLENGTIFVGGIRFVGATLWTGYDLDGSEGQTAAMRAAMAGMRDHHRISMTKGRKRRFTPLHALERHDVSSAYIARTVSTPFRGPTVVVTHHAPSAKSLDPRHEGDGLDGAFASRLDELVASSGAALWIHGHTHHSCDYAIGRTRVLCNPQGYGRENMAFDPALVLEVER